MEVIDQITTPGQSKLPVGWTWKTMDDIADVIGGGTPKTNDSLNYEGGKISWITPADLSGYSAKYIGHGERFITEKGLKDSSARMMPAGTILFSSRAPVGYVAITSNPVCTNQGFKSFVLKNDDILPDYVYWWLKGNKELAESMASGTTFLELSGAKAKQLPIPIAPLNEQKLIVAEIEKQFSRLDEAVENLKRVKANLKRYKAAVLKAAVEGNLTEEWRKAQSDVEPASELLKRILAERRKKWEEAELAKMKTKGRKPKDDGWKKAYKEPNRPDTSDLPRLPTSWTWVTLPQVATFQNGRFFPSKEYSKQGVKLLRPGNLFADGTIKWSEDNTRKMPDAWAKKFPEFLVAGNELIMNLTAQSLKDEFLGRTCLTKNGELCLLNQRLARITPLSGVDPRFLTWVLKAKSFRNFVDTLNTGSLIQHMFTSDLVNFIFPLPSTKEQTIISDKIDGLFSVADENEKAVVVGSNRSERLRQAILEKAFSGSLNGSINAI